MDTFALSLTTHLEVSPARRLLQNEAYSAPPEGLIEDIEMDKRVALKSLARPAYEKFKSDAIFDATQPKL